VLSNFF